MAATIEHNLLQPRTYQPGTYDLNAVVVPLGYAAFVLDIDRTDWLDPAIKVSGRLDLSLDGATITTEGTQWRP